MRLESEVAGRPVTFECFDDLAMQWVCAAILSGRTYPIVPFVGEVDTIVDVGANCGAASVFLAHTYPRATIHAFEPFPEALAYLRTNVAALPRVHVHPVGLDATDRRADLYIGADNPGSSSIHESVYTTDEHVSIELRAAGQFLRGLGVASIDILKVDTEGCELPILTELQPLLAGVKVLYLEFHAEEDRRAIDSLLAPTHVLALGRVMAPYGELLYISRASLPPSGLTGPEFQQWAASCFLASVD